MATAADLTRFARKSQLLSQTFMGALGQVVTLDNEWAGAEGFNPALAHTVKMNQAALDTIFGAGVFTEAEFDNLQGAFAAFKSAIEANIPALDRLSSITIP